VCEKSGFKYQQVPAEIQEAAEKEAEAALGDSDSDMDADI
tara:strand:- start:234 stop:353 length:120 start_codon:yes stop_codon:yes gene_type:complete